MPGPYFVKSGTGGDDSGSSWANAAESIAGLLATATVSGGEIIYCHNTHNNTTAASATVTWTLPESGTGVVKVLSVDGGDATGASLSGTTVGNLYAGASEGTNANYVLVIDSRTNAGVYIYGMTLAAGSGGNDGNGRLNIGNATSGELVFENCTLYHNSTNANSFNVGSTSTSCRVSFLNCQFRFGATTQRFAGNRGVMTWENCKIHASSSAPATLFTMNQHYQGLISCSGCDWSAATNVVSQAVASAMIVRMNNCVIGTPVTGTHSGLGNLICEFHACGAASGTLVIDYYYEDAHGVVQDSQATAGYYLTSGGAEAKDDDGNAVKYSLAMQPSTLVSVSTPLYTPWFYANVATTGDKTVAVKVATATTALKENEVWLEVEYMGEPGLAGTQRVADSPQTVREFDDLCNLVSSTLSRDITVTGDDRTDTTDAWSYNNADWAAAVAHTLTASINIAEQGYIRCRVGLAKDQDTYVDPKITVS